MTHTRRPGAQLLKGLVSSPAADGRSGYLRVDTGRGRTVFNKCHLPEWIIYMP